MGLRAVFLEGCWRIYRFLTDTRDKAPIPHLGVAYRRWTWGRQNFDFRQGHHIVVGDEKKHVFGHKVYCDGPERREGKLIV